MEKGKCSTFKVCAIIVTIMIVFMTGLVTAVVKNGITIKGDFGTVANGTPVAGNVTETPAETETVFEAVTDESGEAVTDESGEAVTEAVVVTKAPVKATSPANVSGAKLNWDDQKILDAYKVVVDKVKVDKPTFQGLDYQPVANKDSLPAEVYDVFYKYFYDGEDPGHESLISVYDTTDLLETEDYARRHDGDNGVYYRNRPDEIIAGEPQNTKWFAVSRSQYGCLLTDATKLKDLTAETLPNGNIKIVLYLPDEESPDNIKDDKVRDTMTSVHSGVMDVSDIGMILDFGPLVFGPTFKSKDASCTFSGSTSTLIYNPKTNECVSLYQVAKIYLKVSGKLKGVDLSGVTVQIDAVYDYFDFKWETVK